MEKKRGGDLSEIAAKKVYWSVCVRAERAALELGRRRMKYGGRRSNEFRSPLRTENPRF